MSQKGFAPIIVLVVILFVVAVGGAYYLGTKMNTPTLLPRTQTIPSQNPVTSELSPSPNPTTAQSSDQITWKRTSSMGNFSFEYPYGWHVANLFKNGSGQDNPINIVVNPEPINAGPRDGPIGAIAINDWNGSQTPDDRLASETAQAKAALEPGYSEETIQTDIGPIDHIQGKLSSLMFKGTLAEFYLFLIAASDNINTQVIEIETINHAASPDIVRHVALSFEKN